MMGCFISNILAKMHHSLLVFDFSSIGADRSGMKVRLDAKLSLRKPAKVTEFMINTVQISFIVCVLSVSKSFILITRR